MGGLVPNPNDLEVINQLDDLFSEPRLDALRQWMATAGNDPELFFPGRHLHRIAYRLQIFPTSAVATNPKGRWFKFLRDCLKERPNGPGTSTNHDIILSALAGFVADDQNCVGIHFWAQYNSGDPPPKQPPSDSQIPSGFDYRAVVTQEPADPATGEYWGSITLLCRHDIPAGAGIIPDPSAANHGQDNGESGAEQPPV